MITPLSSELSYLQKAQLRAGRHRASVEWALHGMQDFESFVNKFQKSTAFVLGTGPSCELVTDQQWRKMSKFFTVGINRFAGLYGLDVPNFPSIAFTVDVSPDKLSYNWWRDTFRKYRSGEGKVLLGYGASIHTAGDWIIHTDGYKPQANLLYGVSTTGQTTLGFSRTALASVHLCGLLGFKNICMVGCDHGPEYGQHKMEYNATGDINIVDYEPRGAAFAYGSMVDFMQHNLPQKPNVWQCGKKAAFYSFGGRKVTTELTDALGAGRLARCENIKKKNLDLALQERF